MKGSVPSPRRFSRILVTGGAGFIGGAFLRHLFFRTDFAGEVVNFDLLTYAGNAESLTDVDAKASTGTGSRLRLVRGDIASASDVNAIFDGFNPDLVVHFAAESHVDRSIHGPDAFVRTNIEGTFRLLEACRSLRTRGSDVLFHHVSTDEVYGSLGATGEFLETTPYDPRSPYSASKAASDHLVRAWGHTYGIPFTLSNCSNNYGPFQFPEKLIPVMIENLLAKKPLPVYGDGGNVRDWLHVDDHARAIWEIVTRSAAGESWNVGGRCERKNLEIVHLLCDLFDRKRGSGHRDLITFVKDRPGHDRRYAVNCDRIRDGLGWMPSVDFAKGLEATLDWYLGNRTWVERVKSGAYREWVKAHYGAAE